MFTIKEIAKEATHNLKAGFKGVMVMFVVMVLLLSLINLGGNATVKADLTIKHDQIDEQLKSDFDFWVAENSMRTFCLPKADLISEEIEIRKALGDDVSTLEARLENVSENCNEVVKQILFQQPVKAKN